jgi:hypothetical protein
VDGIEQVPELIRQLYAIVAELERHFPDRRFTPDGHLVGSIGEVLAAHHYGLELLPASTEGHDATAEDGRQVQVKATQDFSWPEKRAGASLGAAYPSRRKIAIGLQCASRAWENAGRMQSNGQRPISVSRLAQLMSHVLYGDRLPRMAC